MPARFRKSVSLGGGVKLNLNKKSLSVSAGPRGARYTVSSTGRRTTSVGVPGTGLSYRTSAGPRRRGTPHSPSGTGHRLPGPAVVKPGLFAPTGRKKLYRGFTLAQAHGPTEVWTALFDDAAEHPRQAIAAHTLGGVLAATVAPDWALNCLSAVYRTPGAPDADPEVGPYATALSVTATVAGLHLSLPVGRLLVGLLVSMLHEDRGEVSEAQWATQSLPDCAVARLAQADLALRHGNREVAVAQTDGVTNTDDVTAMTLAVRAGALRALGQDGAAVLASREALRFPSRSVVARHRARFESGSAEATLGHTAKARTQFEKILAEDSTYPGIHDALARLNT